MSAATAVAESRRVKGAPAVPDDHVIVLFGATGDAAGSWGPEPIRRLIAPHRWHLGEGR
jgi:hypothetical protein